MANDVSGIVTKTEAAPGLARLSLGFERKSLITRLHVLLLSAKPWGNWTTHSTPTLAPDPLSPSLSLSLSISLSLAHKHARMLALSLTSRLSLTHFLSLSSNLSISTFPSGGFSERNERGRVEGRFFSSKARKQVDRTAKSYRFLFSNATDSFGIRIRQRCGEEESFVRRGFTEA